MLRMFSKEQRKHIFNTKTKYKDGFNIELVEHVSNKFI